MTYLILISSIIAEVFGSTMLKLSDGFTKTIPIIVIIAGYIGAFYLMSIVLLYLPLSVTYAIWSGAGTALTVIIGILVFVESLSVLKMASLIFIILGIVIINKTKQHDGEVQTV